MPRGPDGDGRSALERRETPRRPRHLERQPEPASPAEERRKKLRRRRRRTLIGLLLLPLIGASLVLLGMDRVWNSTIGRYVPAGLEPDQPNYAALVTPTPTFLMVHVDEADQLTSVALLSLAPNDEGGWVIVIPIDTQAQADGTPVTLRQAYADGGARAVTSAVQDTLNIAVGETALRDDPGWARFVAPVAPLFLTLPEAVDRWPAGRVQLDAADIGPFLRAGVEDESELNRVARQELFWEAWLQAVSDGLGQADASAAPGEADVGLGRFVRGLGSGPFTVRSLPVTPAAVPIGTDDPEAGPEIDGDAEVFVPEDALAAELVAESVPFPEEPAVGSRIRVRLLNGTGDPDLNLRAVRPLVRGGAEIAISGNAASFSEPRTRLVYTVEDQEAPARLLREALGVGSMELAPPEDDPGQIEESERIDVTVILGADALRAMDRSNGN